MSKLKREYRPVGTLEAVRGTYALKIGPVTRDFTVSQGTVRYFGTPDLNAELDITAQHVVRTVRTNEEIPVVARITGTLYAPKLALESPVRPPIPETDLASYLIFGAPASDAIAAGQQTALQSAVAAFSSEVERFLISDLGVPIDYVEFQPGIATAGGAAVSRFAFGWRIGTQELRHPERGLLRRGRAVELLRRGEFRRDVRVPVQPGLALPDQLRADLQLVHGGRIQQLPQHQPLPDRRGHLLGAGVLAWPRRS